MVGNLIYMLQGSRNCFVTCRQEQLRESSFKGMSLWLNKLYRRHYIGLIETPTWHILLKLPLHKCVTLKAIKNWRWRNPGSEDDAALVFSANINTTTGTFFTSVQAIGMWSHVCAYIRLIPTTFQFLIAYSMPTMMGRSGKGANEGIVVGCPIMGPNHWTWL